MIVLILYTNLLTLSWTKNVYFCFVCVEGFTAQSTQWSHVEHGQVTLPHVYWAGLVLQAVNQYCAHSFNRNWQLPFLNQRKGENDRRKYFMINLHERMLPTSVGAEPATSWSSVGRRIQLSHWGWLFLRKMKHLREWINFQGRQLFQKCFFSLLKRGLH